MALGFINEGNKMSTAGKISPPAQEPVPIEKINTIESMIAQIRLKLDAILKQVNPTSNIDVVRASTASTFPSELNTRLDQLIYQLEGLESLIDL